MSNQGSSNPEQTAPWTIGVARQGNGPAPRFDEPQHHVLVTVESSSILTNHYIDAETAIIERMARLKESGIKYHREGMTLRFDQPVNGDHVTLTYTNPQEQS